MARASPNTSVLKAGPKPQPGGNFMQGAQGGFAAVKMIVVNPVVDHEA
jgi:hypothetical protein